MAIRYGCGVFRTDLTVSPRDGTEAQLRRSALRRARRALGPIAQTIRVGLWGALSLTAFAAMSGVSADSLAQPPQETLESRAAAYVQFREDVAKIEAIPFTSAETTREAHRLLSAHNSDELTVGWMAYAALIAADTEEFKAEIESRVKSTKRVRGSKLRGRDSLLAELGENPRLGRELPGADKAIERVLQMTLADGARITTLGESFKQQAYAMQKTRWGMARISPAETRLSEAHSFAAARPYPGAPSLPQSDSNGVATPSLASLSGEWSPNWGASTGIATADAQSAAVMDRVLNLAVRYSIGALNPQIIQVYGQNRKSNQCLSMSALTLNQCIAATRAPYEEAFCLGEHGLNDVASCVGWVAAGATP